MAFRRSGLKQRMIIAFNSSLAVTWAIIGITMAFGGTTSTAFQPSLIQIHQRPTILKLTRKISTTTTTTTTRLGVSSRGRVSRITRSQPRPLIEIFKPEQLIEETDNILLNPKPSRRKCAEDIVNEANVDYDDNHKLSKMPMDRRWFFGAAMIGLGGFISAEGASASVGQLAAADENKPRLQKQFGNLQWESTPINKRTGVTVFDAEKAGYNVPFVTYLARFLLVFDADCQKWWYARASDIPRRASADEVSSVRLAQFGAFAASVEVGLQEFEGPDGPCRLMDSLLARYCPPDMETVRDKRVSRGLQPLTEAEENKERREIKEARRQIALLFGLMEVNQPVDRINQLLAAIANGSIASVRIDDGGSGYAPGYGSPTVTFPPPNAGSDYETAKGRAILQPNGRILRIDLQNRGFGYQKAPSVTISTPGADRGVEIPGARAATAKAYMFKNGVNKGRLERVQIIDEGQGYTEGEKIRIVIDPPELPANQGGLQATAHAILELQVSGIEIVDGGTGYAVEKPIPVYVEPPPLTARVNMNDPLTARLIDPSKPLPTTTLPTPEQRKKMPDPKDPESFTALMDKLAKNDGKGGAGNCIGRACYDTAVVAYATARAETSSFSTFRIDTDVLLAVEEEEKVINQVRLISATTGGSDSQQPIFYTGSKTSSSAQLLTLLPAGFGLEYDEKLKRFVLSAGQDFMDINEAAIGASKSPLDPEFGPRGRSPIERDLTLDFSSFIRFCASGAICASGAHLVLTPLDVIKTKIQTDPDNYPGVFAAFKRLVEERGPSGFFAGWVPTTIGFFMWGGFSYSVTELLRRYFNDLLGPQAASLEVPVIIAAAAISSFFSVFILCPFEAVRIRSVAQPGFGKNIVDITNRMVEEEGIGSLFSAVPPFLVKEIPFGVSKFLVFTISTRFLFETFPAAQEDIQLSLFVSLVSGMMGGLAAAIVSNPADATISEMKKGKTKVSPIDAAKNVIERGGYANLFRGLPIRMLFYPLITSMQFFVYDTVRLYLGVGADDLKVYLDVLGSALQDSGSMVGPA